MGNVVRSVSVKVNLEELWEAVTQIQKNLVKLASSQSASSNESLKDAIELVKLRIQAVEQAIESADELEVGSATSLADISVRVETIEQILWGEDKAE